MKKIMLIAPVCFSFAALSDGSVEESSFATIIKALQEQMAQLKDDMNKKDETIAALKAKTEHRQVQLTAGGEVMQLVSEADIKDLAARVAQCEKTNADHEAKLGMTMDTLSKVRKEIKDSLGAPPALPPSPPPRFPPPRPVATPGRRLQSASNANFVNELSITGSNAVVSWNSHTPGLTSFNCTGVGDGKLTCSGEVRAYDFVTTAGHSLTSIIEQLGLNQPPQQPPPPSSPPPVKNCASAAAFMNTWTNGFFCCSGSQLSAQSITYAQCQADCQTSSSCNYFNFWGDDLIGTRWCQLQSGHASDCTEAGYTGCTDDRGLVVGSYDCWSA